MLIEFLYSRFEQLVYGLILFNLLQVVVFVLAINVSNDRWNLIAYCSDETTSEAAQRTFLARSDGEANEVSHECDNPLYTVAELFESHDAQIWLGVANFGLTFLQGVLTYNELLGLGGLRHLYEFLTFWRVIEVAYMSVNCALSYCMIFEVQSFGEGSSEGIRAIRTIASIDIIFIFLRGLYSLKFIQYLSRHIDILFLIIEESWSFLVILAIAVVVFAISFYQIGRN